VPCAEEAKQESGVLLGEVGEHELAPDIRNSEGRHQRICPLQYIAAVWAIQNLLLLPKYIDP
jgi:hypothetical protein